MNPQPEPSGDQAAKVYDLAERTARFGEMVLRFCKSLQLGTINRPLVDQLIRAATSIGANYCEADEAISKRDFRHKIAVCKKEAKEAKYWLRLFATIEDSRKVELRSQWQEAHEIHLIFCAIYRKCLRDSKRPGQRNASD